MDKIMNVTIRTKNGEVFSFKLREDVCEKLFQDFRAPDHSRAKSSFYTTLTGGRREIVYAEVSSIDADPAEEVTDANPFEEVLTPALAALYVEYLQRRLELVRMMDAHPALRELLYLTEHEVSISYQEERNNVFFRPDLLQKKQAAMLAKGSPNASG